MSPSRSFSLSCPAAGLRRAASVAALAALLGAPAALGQQALFSAVGGDTSDVFGSSVAPAGDVNGDGTADVLVAGFAAGAGPFQFGTVQVLSGKGGAVLRTWTGVEQGGTFGGAVASVGDINKDGFADVLVGAAYTDANGTNSGRAIVYSGGTGAVLFTLAPAPAFSAFGSSVTGLGDIDNDTWPDFAVGAQDYDLPGAADAGRVYVYSGHFATPLAPIDGTLAGEAFGHAIDNAGDVNGDGRNDLLIGAPYHLEGGTKGRIEVRSGASLATTLFAKNALLAGEDLGQSVSGAGDVNDDGFADVIAGGYFADAAAGVARVFLGPTGTASWVFHGDAAGDHLGGAVDGAGDIDKDGFDDVIVGAYQSGLSLTLQGYVRVHSGRTGGVLYSTFTGEQGGSVFGVSVAGVGDVNGDGWADLAVGADAWDGPGGEDQGKVVVYDVLQHATNVGFGGPGAAQLSMYGSPLDGFGQMDLALTGAKPNAPAWLLASTSTSFLSFKGGVLVPNVAIGVIIPLATNGVGKITIPGILGGFGPVSIVIQYVIKDAAQPLGYAMSNAVAPMFLP